MKRTSPFAPRRWSILLSLVLTLTALTCLPQRAGAAPIYGADDQYLLVKSCVSAQCLAAANWAPYENQLHQLFTQGGWGNDTAVVSRNQGRGATWAAWSANHVSYIDGVTWPEIRAQLAVAYDELRATGTVHVIYVAPAR